MSSIAQQESLVKESLFEFVTRNIPSADLSVIDEIVLSYVISILEEASQDPCFDVEGFIEMMSAYFPDFSGIETAVVCSWIFELEAELSRRSNGGGGDSDDSKNDSASSDKISLTLQSLSEMLPQVNNNKGMRSHSNSESSDYNPKSRRIQHISETWSDCSSNDSQFSGPNGIGNGHVPPPAVEFSFMEECDILQEMFPHSGTMEIKQCLTIADGDISRATQILLHRREGGQSLGSHAGAALLPGSLNRGPKVDDNELKNRIIARYSYVNKNSDMKEHKPLAPKMEPKKLVRYRDNKIVSLKGERYTEVAKGGAEEEQPKKPKKPHCP